MDAMSYWTYTDIFEEAGPGPDPFHGGFGMMNNQGLCKPSYFAYRFLCELPDMQLATFDADSYAATDGETLHVLLWDYTHPAQDADNQSYFIRDLAAKTLDDTVVELTAVPEGDYTVETTRVGHMVNDVYTRYLRGGFTDLMGWETPTREQMNILRENANGKAGKAQVSCMLAPMAAARLMVSMRQNDVVRIVLRRNAGK